MSSKKLIEDKLRIDNAIYWHHNGDEIMKGFLKCKGVACETCKMAKECPMLSEGK